MVRYIIIENERLSRIELENNLRSLRPDWKYVGYAESVEEAATLISDAPDTELIFMDIELDDGQCFEIFDRCNIEGAIIFTTAYSEYALKAFHLNSLDYLLKPFDRDHLENAIVKFEKFTRGGEQIEESDQPEAVTSFPKEEISRILIQKGEDYGYMKLEDVGWFISEDKYVFCVNNRGEKHITSFKSLNDIELRLPGDNFFRLRRNIIAAISSIRSVSKFHKGSLRVRLETGGNQETVVVNQKNKGAFLAWFGAS